MPPETHTTERPAQPQKISRQVRRANARRREKEKRKHLNEEILRKNKRR